MLYRESAPSGEISHLVLSFWEFAVTGEDGEPIIHEVFSDGCISLVYHRNKNSNQNTLFIHGLGLTGLKAPVFAGDTYWGMRFLPSACANILRCKPSEVRMEILNNSENFIHLSHGALEKLTVCESFENAVEIYTKQLKPLEIKLSETDKKVAEVLKIIEENPGEIKISEIARQIGLSTRQLERRFKNSAGLTPKQFARARRLRATAVNLLDENKQNWANRAAEMGFSDQAHLTHEFSSLTGRSPNSFAEKIKSIEHGNIVK
jgi:AraC-like DNA-binding protein